jgi:hypothetical protein
VGLCFGAFREMHACLLAVPVYITSLMEWMVVFVWDIAYLHTYRYDCDIRGSIWVTL